MLISMSAHLEHIVPNGVLIIAPLVSEAEIIIQH